VLERQASIFTSLPPMDMEFSIYPLIFFFVFSPRNLISATELLLAQTGVPRYLIGQLPF
jgi:hypothetical protein